MSVLMDAITSQIISENSDQAKAEKKAIDTWVDGKQQDLRDRYLEATQELATLIKSAEEKGYPDSVVKVWEGMLLSYGKKVAAA